MRHVIKGPILTQLTPDHVRCPKTVRQTFSDARESASTTRGMRRSDRDRQDSSWNCPIKATFSDSLSRCGSTTRVKATKARAQSALGQWWDSPLRVSIDRNLQRSMQPTAVRTGRNCSRCHRCAQRNVRGRLEKAARSIRRGHPTGVVRRENCAFHVGFSS